MEIGLKKLRKLGDSYLETLECFKCHGKIQQFCGFDDVCEECIRGDNGVVKVDLYCQKCRTNCRL